MKVLVVACGVWAAGCSSLPGASRPEAARPLGAVLDAWHDAAARGDFDAYFGMMTQDAVFLGTDATERWVGAEFRDYARPHFDGPTEYGQGAWTYRPVERHVENDSRCEGVAWFDEVLVNDAYGRCRGTGVAVLGPDRRWRVAHYSLTFLVPNDIAGEVTGRVKAFEAAQAR